MGGNRHGVIAWTPAKLVRLKAAYQQAIDAGLAPTDVFSFDGHDLVVGYARYLIIYLDKTLASPGA